MIEVYAYLMSGTNNPVRCKLEEWDSFDDALRDVLDVCLEDDKAFFQFFDSERRTTLATMTVCHAINSFTAGTAVLVDMRSRIVPAVETYSVIYTDYEENGIRRCKTIVTPIEP